MKTKKKKKNAVLYVRLTTDEHARIVDAARAKGLTASAYVRMLLMEHLR